MFGERDFEVWSRLLRDMKWDLWSHGVWGVRILGFGPVVLGGILTFHSRSSSDSCAGLCFLPVPESRMTEWVCHTIGMITCA